MSYRIFTTVLLTALLPVSVHAQMSDPMSDMKMSDMNMSPTSRWSVMAHSTLTFVADDRIDLLQARYHY